MFSENTTTYVKLEETSDCIRIEETSSDAAPTIEENLEHPEEEFKEEHQELLSELKEPEQTSSVEITPSEPTKSDPMVAEKTANKCLMGCSVM